MEHRAAVAACPTQEVLGRLGDKWVPLVLTALRDGRRHGELARTVAGARQKVLTQTLRGLERDGLVARTVTPGVPVRVDYALTPLGRGLLDVVGRGVALGGRARPRAARGAPRLRRG
jgi:DNA-binding HxlR family transcriptional regulator